MVGTSSFDQAYTTGMNELSQYKQAGTLLEVDVTAARPLGISPAPM